MKTILWIYDLKGWAYWNRAHKLAEQMPQYEHKYIGMRERYSKLQTAMNEVDLIVCMYHGLAPLIAKWSDKTVMQISGTRGL